MREDDGRMNFPIWLLGDSEPDNWKDILETPLDPRHPIRHNIWTSVLDIIQDEVYRENGKRIDSSAIYIRNAIRDAVNKPSRNEIVWQENLCMEVNKLKDIIELNKPPIIICFGAFAFEFARRALEEEPKRNYHYWGARELGYEFRNRINSFQPMSVTLIPLLHRSIAGGKFIQSHNYFCNNEGANYFKYVGSELAKKILEYIDQPEIWIKRNDA